MKNVIITGGAEGIGYGITKDLLENDYRVIVLDKKKQKLKEIKSNKNLIFIKVDLNKTNSFQNLIKNLIKKYGEIFGLINNVRAGKQLSLENETIKNWNLTLSVNLKASFFLSQNFIKFKKTKKYHSKIINISSIADELVTGQSPSYHCSKAALKILTKYLSIYSSKKKIIVNSISPGFIIKNRSKHYFEGTKITKKNQILSNAHPSNRVGNENDISKLILFLLSENSNFINGENIKVDGGITGKENINFLKNYI